MLFYIFTFSFQLGPNTHLFSIDPRTTSLQVSSPPLRPPSLRCWVQYSADIWQAVLCCHSVVPQLLKPPPCHYFPHFPLCFLFSEFELILGAVPIHFPNYHLVFIPHRCSLCPVTAEIRISAIAHAWSRAAVFPDHLIMSDLAAVFPVLFEV